MAPKPPVPPDRPAPTLRDAMATAARTRARPPRKVLVLWAVAGGAVLAVGIAQIAGWSTSPVAERVLEERRRAAPPGGPGAATRTVVLRDAGGRPAEVVEAIRSAAGLSPEAARAVVEGAPKSVVSGVAPAEAERVKGLLEAAGATVEVR